MCLCIETEYYFNLIQINDYPLMSIDILFHGTFSYIHNAVIDSKNDVVENERETVAE